jgi:subtilisin family serine protease
VASEPPARGPDCRSDDQERTAIARAIDAAVADHVRIISTSLGLPGTNGELIAAVQRALDAGIVVVAATGDKRVPSVVNPAAIRGTVAVAAVDEDYLPWSGNVAGDRAAFVISAPGFRVPTGYFRADRWSSMQVGTGTSEATPLVAGGLALVAARYPSATGNQLIQHLIHNPAGNRPFGLDPDYGYGVISVPRMLAADPTQWPDVNPLRDRSTQGAPIAPVAPAPVAADAAVPPKSVETAAHPVPPASDTSRDRLLQLARIVVAMGSGALLLAMLRRRDGARSHTRAPTRGD